MGTRDLYRSCLDVLDLLSHTRCVEFAPPVRSQSKARGHNVKEEEGDAQGRRHCAVSVTQAALPGRPAGAMPITRLATMSVLVAFEAVVHAVVYCELSAVLENNITTVFD